MVQDLEDPFVDLPIAQLLGEGAIGITWPQVQPYLGHPQPEWLDLVVEKCPQQVHISHHAIAAGLPHARATTC
jgi:hypothetical protein